MDFFMTLVGIGIGGFIIYLIIDRFPAFKKFLLSEEADAADICSWKFWSGSFKNDEIRKRLFFTIAIIIIYKLLYLIPIPGISTAALSEFYQRTVAMSGGSVGRVMLQFTGGFGDKFNIMTLGFMPYLSACVLLQLISVIIPPLRKQFFNINQSGRQNVVKISLILSLILCIIQAFMMTLWLEHPNAFMGMAMVPNPGWGFRFIAGLTLVGAFCLILWLARLITDKGIGNGIAVLILSDIFVSLVSSCIHGVSELNHSSGQMMVGVVYILSLVPIFLVAVFATKWTKGLSFSTVGKEIKLPVRLSWVAREPVSWAQGILLLPATIASFSGAQAMQEFASSVSRGNVFYYLLLAILIILVAFLYKNVVFRAAYMKEMFKKYFDGNAEGNTSRLDSFTLIAQKASLYLGLLLLFLAVIPDVVMGIFKVPYFIASVYGGAAFLIITGVISDIAERIKSIQIIGQTGCREVCHVASDEIEALIKKSALEKNGIASVIEPLRFTWGIPIRTAIDEYRLYVKNEDISKAKEVLA